MNHEGRPRCARCLRPQSACLCTWITPTDNLAEVLVLQHPLETHHAKNSARLLDLSLQRSQMIVGETFDPAQLAQQLDRGGLLNVLLYPADGNADLVPIDAVLPEDARQIRLIVLDGTWRKSRKLLHLNPALQHLPRLALKAPPPSAYLIRKAHRPGQLSTLEATCRALAQLESAPDRYAPLLAAFGSFVGSQRR